MNILRRLEKKIDEVMKKVPSGSGGQDEPLETRRAILDEMESKIVSLGGGRRVFPFNMLKIQLLARDIERQALYEVAFVKNNALAAALRERLSPPRCEPVPDLEVSVEIVEERGLDWAGKGHRVDYDRRRVEEKKNKGEAKSPAQLIVMQGEAEQTQYSITKKRTNIGRQAEVLDKDGLPLRRNDLIFLEDGCEINQTVSRLHAHINYDRDAGEYRLHDDNSAYGTLIIRASGSRVKVTRSLGTALNSGDEIFFGQARVIFKNE
jgi:FHA domain